MSCQRADEGGSDGKCGRQQGVETNSEADSDHGKGGESKGHSRLDWSRVNACELFELLGYVEGAPMRTRAARLEPCFPGAIL